MPEKSPANGAAAAAGSEVSAASTRCVTVPGSTNVPIAKVGEGAASTHRSTHSPVADTGA